MQQPLPFSLKSTVGNGLENRPGDVRRVKETFNALDLYDVPGHGLTDFIDRDLDSAIRTFQKKKNLKVDGIINPKGETQRALKSVFGEKPDRSEENKPLPSFGRETAILERAGFEYIPDPLGRVNQGHFEDKDGRIIDQGQRLKLLKADEEKKSNGTRPPLKPKKRAEEKNVELAFGPAVPAGVAAAKFFAGNPAALAAIMGAMGIGVALSDEERRKQAKKLLEKLGSKEGAGNIETFPAEKPKTPNHTGHDVEGPVEPQKETFPAKESERPIGLKGPQTDPKKPEIETLPAKETSPEDFIVLMPHPGDPKTRKGIDMGMNAVKEMEELFGIEIDHIAGGSENGAGKVRVKERKVSKEKAQKQGFSYPDIGYEIPGKGKVYINTGKTKKDGNPIASEQRQLERLKGNVKENDWTIFLPKLRPEMDELDMEKKIYQEVYDQFVERLGSPPKRKR